MKNRKQRMKRCLSLLLAGALSMSGSADIWANEEMEADGDVYLTESVNELENSWEEVDAEAPNIENPIKEIVSDNTLSDNALSDDTFLDNVLSENTAPHQENENDLEPVISDNILSSDALSQDEVNDTAELEESEPAEEKIEEKPVEVVLPSSVSLNMIVFGDEKLEGMVESEQFCIENMGYEDVKVSVQGICSGEKEGDLVMSSSSTRDESIPGKKNAWIYLQWEDENREVLDQPEIVLGDETRSGDKGEILLKAPERGQSGEITGENNASKVYFSFAGDMRSDTGEAWKNGELKLKLLFFVEKMNASDPNLSEQISTLK